MRASAGFRMELNTESAGLAVLDAFAGSVIEVHVTHLALAGEGVRVDAESVVLGCYLNAARRQVLDRLVQAAVAKLELVGASAQGQAQHLMAQTYAKERRLAHELPNGCNTFGHGRRVSRAIG